MVPQPLEANFMQQPPQEQQPRGGSISLGMLIDFIIQRTYHDLTVLAELLPRKTDMERKIEIYNFSARTRQLFIRLLALVKWANSASKVDKSAHIMSFLDKQSLLFIETADMLARTARETLVHARLPNFHIPAAVEILTTGTYGRLPSCIKEKIVPPDPITAAEKGQTLQRLNQVIQYRLVTGNLIPQMRKFRIEAGRVTFRVDNEFEVSLTVMGDGPAVPWRLLDIDVLVEDKETGDGKQLVHTLQVNYIHQLIQARLVDNQSALTEVYGCLHFFCQSLQLEVLYTQTLRLICDRLHDNIFVDEYAAGSRLTVSYWRELTSKDPKSELGYKLTVQTDPADPARPLAVIHVPSIGNKESSEVADRAVRSELLSMERLLVHTVYVRSLARLGEIRTELQGILKGVDFHLQGTPAILTVPILSPCLRAEQLHITVDTHTGMFHCHVPKHIECPLVVELQQALNNDHNKLANLISELRYWITCRRCEKTLQHLPATSHEALPLRYADDSKLKEISKHRVYIKLHRNPNVVLIVELKEKPEQPTEMEYVFYLAHVTQEATDLPAEAESGITDASAKLYLKVSSIVEFDTFVNTHGPGTYVDEIFVSTMLGKRKANGPDLGPPPKQKTIYPAYFIPELAHIVAMCDEKLPFVNFAKELSQMGIPHSGLQVEANATTLGLKLLALPKPSATTAADMAKMKCVSPPAVTKDVWTSLMKRLLGTTIRLHSNRHNQTRSWTAELVFFSTPLASAMNKEQGMRRPVYLHFDMLAAGQTEKTIQLFLEDWARIVYLYALIHDFAEVYKSDRNSLQNIVSIKSYSYTSLLLAYGPNKEPTMKVAWSTQANEFKITFSGGNVARNAHAIMTDQLQSHLNRTHNLTEVVHILHETYHPLSSVIQLPMMPQLGVAGRTGTFLSFCILPQSPTVLRIIYQATNCLEVRFKGSGLVSIRDGAYSRFDHCQVVNELTPTPGLKTFLSKYVDETAVYRRRSQSEDDNPPSPIPMGDGDMGGGGGSPFPSVNPGSVGGPSSVSSMRGPQSPRDGGLRFQQPHTPPSVSNPHTPASPHPGHPNFGMTSPPASHMPHPSPSMLPLSPAQPSPMAANSPGPHSLTPYMPGGGGGAGHLDGSPFAAMSPAASNWPGSPSIARPSPRSGQSPDHKGVGPSHGHHLNRVLPQKSWAGAVPTLLTQEALATLCKRCPHPQRDVPGKDLSPLERFLGCVYMRKQLQRQLQTENFMKPLPCNEAGVVKFKLVQSLYECQVFLNPVHMQSLHIKIQQQQQMGPQGMGQEGKLYAPEEIQVIEQFFDTRIVAPPYRQTTLLAFNRFMNIIMNMNSRFNVEKDFIQLMSLEMMPNVQAMGLHWRMQYCLRVPPSAAQIIPIGMAAIIVVKTKILFFIQITRIPYIQGMECTSLVLPILYDIQTNATQLAEKRELPSIALATANNHLRKFSEIFGQQQQNKCTLFPAIRHLLENMVLPTEPPMPQQQQQQQQMMGNNQMVNSPNMVPVGAASGGTVGMNVMNPNMGGVMQNTGYGDMGGGGGNIGQGMN